MMPDYQTTPKPDIPDHITMEQRTEGLVFTYRWFSVIYVALLVFAVFWDAFLVQWYGMALAPDAPLIAVIFPVFHVLAGAAITYFALTGVFNRTEIKVGQGQLSVRHMPLPWRGNRVLDSSNIAQLYSSELRIRSSKGTQLVYQLIAITIDNKKIRLLSNLSSPEQVRYLERKIEEQLGIKDAPVEGEISG